MFVLDASLFSTIFTHSLHIHIRHSIYFATMFAQGFMVCKKYTAPFLHGLCTNVFLPLHLILRCPGLTLFETSLVSFECKLLEETNNHLRYVKLLSWILNSLKLRLRSYRESRYQRGVQLFFMECIATNMFLHVHGTFLRWFIVVRLPWSWLNLEIVSYFSIRLFSSLYSVYFFSLFFGLSWIASIFLLCASSCFFLDMYLSFCPCFPF